MSSKGNFDVCILSETDRLSFTEFLQKSWRETYSVTFGNDITERMISELKRSAAAEVFPGKDEKAYIVRNGLCIVGSSVIAQRGSISYLWGVYVLKSCQRRRIGSQLVRQAVLYIDINSDVRVIVLNASVSAVCFYQHLGFQTVDTTKFEVARGFEADALIMSAPASLLRETTKTATKLLESG